MKTLVLGLLIGFSLSSEAVWKCETRSNGLSFDSKGATRSDASRNTVRRCRQSKGTNSGDCRLNLSCNEIGGGFGSGSGSIGGGSVSTPRVTCNTESNGLVFSKSGRNTYNVRERAINTCLNNYNTTGFECRVNVSCSTDSYVSPMVTCETRSRGKVFTDMSRNVQRTRDHVMDRCMNAYDTNDYQCRSNVLCGDELLAPPVKGFSQRVVNVAKKMRTLVADMRYDVPYYLYSDNLVPLKKQADRLETRMKNRVEAQRLKNTMIWMKELIDRAENTVDSAYTSSARTEYRRRMNKLDKRLSYFISEINDNKYHIHVLY